MTWSTSGNPKAKTKMAALLAQSNGNDSSSYSTSPYLMTSTKVLICSLSGPLNSEGHFTWSFRSHHG